MNTSSTNRSEILPTVSKSAVGLLIGALIVCWFAAMPAGAAGNGGNPNAGKGGPGKVAPTPDIVYMSSSSYAPYKPAIRGIEFTITNGAVSSTDSQLAKALAGRDGTTIAWSPDGSRYAWIEGQDLQTQRIMWAAPGKAATILYRAVDSNDAYVWNGSDVLAWGSACSGDGSVLVFARAAKWDPILEAYTEPSAIMGVDIDPAVTGSDIPPSHGSPRLIMEVVDPNRFAFSSNGHHLAFNAGRGTSAKVSVLPMCIPNPIPATLLTRDDLGTAEYPFACSDQAGSTCPCNGDPARTCTRHPNPAVHSMDWSRDDSRLAFSVTVGADPDYPWRDLRVAYLEWNEGSHLFEMNRVQRIALDSSFGAASSEHSPQWGPSDADNDCERLAFSQSAGASDGSTMTGRRLYFLDLVTTSTACFDGPTEITAKDPRAIDWK